MISVVGRDCRLHGTVADMGAVLEASTGSWSGLGERGTMGKEGCATGSWVSRGSLVQQVMEVRSSNNVCYKLTTSWQHGSLHGWSRGRQTNCCGRWTVAAKQGRGKERAGSCDKGRPWGLGRARGLASQGPRVGETGAAAWACLDAGLGQRGMRRPVWACKNGA